MSVTSLKKDVATLKQKVCLTNTACNWRQSNIEISSLTKQIEELRAHELSLYIQEGLTVEQANVKRLDSDYQVIREVIKELSKDGCWK